MGNNNNKSDIECLFKHGQVNIYAVDYLLNLPDQEAIGGDNHWTL